MTHAVLTRKTAQSSPSLSTGNAAMPPCGYPFLAGLPDHADTADMKAAFTKYMVDFGKDTARVLAPTEVRSSKATRHLSA